MVKNILIINIGIYFITKFVSFPLSALFGVHYIFSDYWYIFQYFTYMWFHSTSGFMHLFGNMFAVLIFGPMLERVWGSKRFLIFYLATGIGAGLLYGVADTIEKGGLSSDKEAFIQNPNPDDFYIYVHEHGKRFNIVALSDFADEYYDNENNPRYIEQAKYYVKEIYDGLANIPMIGASGAVFGILMAFAMLFPNTELLLLFPPIPIKAKYLVFFYGAYELYSEINRTGGDNVAHFAHLSGMLIAFIILKIWQRNTGRFY